jgi:hypothetical protein
VAFLNWGWCGRPAPLERVSVLRGELTAGPAGGDWTVGARLPLPMTGSRPGTEMMSP